jgi:hypothetical protein
MRDEAGDLFIRKKDSKFLLSSSSFLKRLRSRAWMSTISESWSMVASKSGTLLGVISSV